MQRIPLPSCLPPGGSGLENSSRRIRQDCHTSLTAPLPGISSLQLSFTEGQRRPELPDPSGVKLSTPQHLGAHKTEHAVQGCELLMARVTGMGQVHVHTISRHCPTALRGKTQQSVEASFWSQHYHQHTNAQPSVCSRAPLGSSTRNDSSHLNGADLLPGNPNGHSLYLGSAGVPHTGLFAAVRLSAEKC